MVSSISNVSSNVKGFITETELASAINASKQQTLGSTTSTNTSNTTTS